MSNLIEYGDCREILRTFAAMGLRANTCVTSPPYFGLRDYGHDGQLGLEASPDEYVANLVEVFRCVRDVLRDDGTLWLNAGDSYSNGGRTTRDDDRKLPQRAMGVRPADGMKPKDLIGIPWMLAFALRADGWYLRQEIIWAKPNPMPESVRDRCTKSHEQIFLLSKSPKYYFDSEAIKEPTVCDRKPGRKVNNTKENYGVNNGGNTGLTGLLQRYHNGGAPTHRNRRSVWIVTTKPFQGAHFATFPPDLIEPCILAGCPEGGTVLDPFMGSGTTAAVAKLHGRHYLGSELNPDYRPLIEERLK